MRRLIQRRGSAANLVAAMPTDLIPEATNDRRSDLDGLAMMWLDGALAVPSAWKDVRDMAAWSRLFGRQA